MNFKLIALPVSLLMLAACNQPNPTEQAEQAAPVNLETDADRFSYGLGMVVGERVLKQYNDIDYEMLIAGMKAQHQGQPTLLTIEEASVTLESQAQQALATQTQMARERGEAYLKQNATSEDVTVTDSGLQYSVLTAGQGEQPKSTDRVSVHYRGTLLDGTEFDSSYSRGEPASFALNQVIPGWTEGLQLMNTGSKYRFVIPFDLAYGERGAGGSIGPFETLIFEVELIEILAKS